MLLATGVKDALRIGYLLLFIMKARQPSSGADGRHHRRESVLGPVHLDSPPSSLPQALPLSHHLPLLTSQPRGGVGVQFLEPTAAPQACTPNIYGESAQRGALPMVSCGASVLSSRGRKAKRTKLGGQADMDWCRVPLVTSSLTLGTSLPLPERAPPLCALGT